MNPLWFVVIAALIAIVLVVLARRRRRDAMGEFRRRIDALSSDARRPVVDQVQHLKDDPDGP